MGMIPEYARGQLATLTATFAQQGQPTDPSDLFVTIYHKGDVVVAAASPTKVETGQWYKEISIPVNWDLDYYDAIWTGVIGGVSFRRSQTFKVIVAVTEDDTSLPSDSYCTVADVLEELAGIDCTVISGYVNLLARRIVFMEKRVNERTHRTWNRITTTSYFNGNGDRVFQLPRIPVYEVSLVTIRITPNVDWWTPQNLVYVNVIDSHGITLRTASSDADVKLSDLVVDVVNGTLTIPERVLYVTQHAYPFWNYTFIEGFENLKVAWTYGYNAETRPDSIRLLCSKMTAIQFLQIYGDKLSGGAAGLSTDGFGRSYAGFPFAGRIQMLKEDIEGILETHRMVGVN